MTNNENNESILDSYFKSEEKDKVLKRIETQDNSFKEKYEKIRNDPEYKLKQLEEKIQKIEATFEERFNVFKEAVLSAEKEKNNWKDNATKEKEEEKKWFSWEVFSKAVKDNWWWLSFAGIWAWFMALWDSLIWSVKDTKDEIVEVIKEVKNNVVSSVTNEATWTFDEATKIYTSKDSKMTIRFKDNNEVETIKINWETYKIKESGYKLEERDGRKCLVLDNTISDNVFSLDYLWKTISDSWLNKDTYKINENSLVWIGSITPDIVKWTIEIKKEWIEKVSNNGKSTKKWSTEIFFSEKIDENNANQKLKIEKLEIAWQAYSLSMWGKSDPIEFNLIEEDGDYFIDYKPDWISGFTNMTSWKIKIEDISSLVTKSWHIINEDSFSLYKLINENDSWYKKVWDYFSGKVWDPIIATKIQNIQQDPQQQIPLKKSQI